MRAFALVATSLLIALPARANPAPPKRTITIHTDPIVVYRGVRADGTMVARTPIPRSLAPTPPPKCKTDRRGGVHCVITY